MGFDTAVKYLYNLSISKGFLSFDDIDSVANDNKITLEEFDRLTGYLHNHGVIIIDGMSASTSSTYIDRARDDYDVIFDEVIKLDDNLRPYIDIVRRYTPPQLREIDILMPQAKNGNKYAIERIVEMYSKIAIKNALYYSKRYKLGLADSIQDALIGILKAIDSYDQYSANTKFQTYMPWWIRQNILRECKIFNPLVYYPAHMKGQLIKIYKLKTKHMQVCNKCVCNNDVNCGDLVNEVIVNFALSKDQALEFLSYLKPFQSIEDFYIEEEFTLSDHGIHYELLIERIELSFIRKTIKSELEKLKPQERDILRKRFGLCNNNPMTLEEIGKEYKVTRERIRQIEAKAIKKLRSSKQMIKAFN